MQKPLWMSDPTLSHIPTEKLDFLSEMFEKAKGKNQKELLPFFMAMSSKWRSTISFSKEEMELIVAAIKRASSTDEQKQIEKIIDMAAKKSKNT